MKATETEASELRVSGAMIKHWETLPLPDTSRFMHDDLISGSLCRYCPSQYPSQPIRTAIQSIPARNDDLSLSSCCLPAYPVHLWLSTGAAIRDWRLKYGFCGSRSLNHLSSVGGPSSAVPDSTQEHGAAETGAQACESLRYGFERRFGAMLGNMGILAGTERRDPRIAVTSGRTASRLHVSLHGLPRWGAVNFQS